ncbi:hypothetical protein [Sulfurovum sp. NBC37-1]|uniref:hypothetical protein n=1 Tax=Sulfurovum sp. (strain NBC37-1) TaxID=387093 RepID=UPI00015877C0|nr:hypothetical protein [Sulfurovum sp. NBC37-1]BAF71642.1 conserved hypothetical protein [Sulfurovum sp. NBC37-1]
MKKLMGMVAFALLVTMTVPTVSMAGASAKKGQKIFKKKFRKACGFSGVRFSRNHTSAEWEEIYEKGKFKDEAKKICPRLKLKKIKKSWWPSVYEFSHKYASDGVVPKC